MKYKCIECGIIEEIEDENRYKYSCIRTLEDGKKFMSVDVYCEKCGSVMTRIIT